MHRYPNEPVGDALEQFQMARTNPGVDNEEFAARVCGLAIFQEKHALAVAIAGRRNAQADDAGQQAVLTILDYLTRTRGWDFQGTSADEFGGWLYCLSRQHIRWALGNIDRSTRRRQHYEQTAARPLILHADVSAQNGRVAWLVDAVAKLPDELRTIVAAILLGDDVTTITGRLGISRRTYYRLREQGFELLRKLLSDENGDDDCSSLVPA